MFNPLKKTFESDNEGTNKKSALKNNSEYKDKEKNPYMGNKTKLNKFKVPKNFGKKKFKYTIEEESDTNMILEQEYENINKEKTPTNTINLRLLSNDAIIWKKSGIFLLEIYLNKNKKNDKYVDEEEDEDSNSNNSGNSSNSSNGNKTLEYLYRLTNNTKDFKEKIEIKDEKDIKSNIINYINQFKYKIKLLIIYLEQIQENEPKPSINEIIINNPEKPKDLNSSGFSNTVFITLFSSSEINVPFYVITKEYLYAKLFNKKLNYIFMNNDFLSDKTVKVLLFHDKKISPNNSKNNLIKNEIEDNKNNEPIVITTRGFLPEFKETKINIEGSTSSTLSLSSDEDYLDNSVIYTKNGIGILEFKINDSM
jgi:hypothetical protein